MPEILPLSSKKRPIAGAEHTKDQVLPKTMGEFLKNFSDASLRKSFSAESVSGGPSKTQIRELSIRFYGAVNQLRDMLPPEVLNAPWTPDVQRRSEEAVRLLGRAAENVIGMEDREAFAQIDPEVPKAAKLLMPTMLEEKS